MVTSVDGISSRSRAIRFSIASSDVGAIQVTFSGGVVASAFSFSMVLRFLLLSLTIILDSVVAIFDELLIACLSVFFERM